MTTDSLKIISVNIHKGFGIFNRKFVLPKLRDALRSSNADLVLLQEVLGEHEGFARKHQRIWPGVGQYEYLADSVWDEFAYGKNAVYSQGHHGNALLSKFPITQWKNHDISLNGLEMRGVLYAQVLLPFEPSVLHVFCTHLSLREKDRQIQIKRIAALLEKIPPDEPLILGGILMTGELNFTIFVKAWACEKFFRQVLAIWRNPFLRFGRN